MSDDLHEEALKEALTRVLTRIDCDNAKVLDSEDQEMLVQYALGKLSKRELEAFVTTKAARMEQQIKRPQ